MNKKTKILEIGIVKRNKTIPELIADEAYKLKGILDTESFELGVERKYWLEGWVFDDNSDLTHPFLVNESDIIKGWTVFELKDLMSNR